MKHFKIGSLRFFLGFGSRVIIPYGFFNIEYAGMCAPDMRNSARVSCHIVGVFGTGKNELKCFEVFEVGGFIRFESFVGSASVLA